MASKGVNKAILIGNLGKDPEVKYLPSGSAVCNFSVATSESWKDKQTGQQQEKTEWHNISMFGKLAEIAGKYLQKGSKVYLEGSIQTRKWQDKEGNDRYTTDIKANQMQMLDSKGGEQSQSGNDQTQNGNAQGGNGPAPDFDQDVPFSPLHYLG